MLPRHLVASIPLLAILVLPHAARAEHVSLHGVGAVSVGYNDNALALPKNGPAGTPAPFGVAFTDLRPGAILYIESPRFSNRFRYTNTTSLFLGHSEANSYANTVDYGGFYAIGPRSELVLGAAFTQGRLNTFSTQSSASQTGVFAVPAGGVSFVSPSATESLMLEATPSWRITEMAMASFYKPADEAGQEIPDGALADFHLGTEHAWMYDSIGVDAHAGYALLGAQRTNGVTVFPQRQQVILGGLVKYKRDLSRTLSMEADAGAVEAARVEDFGGRVWGPALLGALRWTAERGNAELTYERSMAPNILLAQSFYSDLVTLRGGAPLGGPQSKWLTAASVGYQHGRMLDTNTGTFASTIDVILADVAVSYVPNSTFSVTGRVQRFQQIGHAGDVLPLPTFTRDVYFVTVTGMWPPREEQEAPYRLPVRVDQSDPTPLTQKMKQKDSSGGGGEQEDTGGEGGDDEGGSGGDDSE